MERYHISLFSLYLQLRSHDSTTFVLVFSLLLPESPWEANDVPSCSPAPRSQAARRSPPCTKADEYANDWRQRQKRDGARSRGARAGGGAAAESDMCQLVMSCIQASRVTAAVVTA